MMTKKLEDVNPMSVDTPKEAPDKSQISYEASTGGLIVPINEARVRNLMQKHGLIPPDALERDTLQRCVTETSPDKQNGAYILIGGTRPCLFVQNWACDDRMARYTLGYKLKDLSSKEKVALEADLAKRRAEFQAAQETRWKEAEDEVSTFMDGLRGTDAWQSEYLRRKLPGIRKDILARILSTLGYDSTKGALIIPMYRLDGANFVLCNVQRIFINRDGESQKLFWPGGRTKGAFAMIPWAEGADCGRVLACEGYATGLSAHLATGLGVYCAMSAGNLKDVAMALATHFRDQGIEMRIMVAADHDKPVDRYKDPKTMQPLDGGIGRFKAEEAARAIHGTWCMPPSEEYEGMDFNDLFVKEGAEAVEKIGDQFDLAKKFFQTYESKFLYHVPAKEWYILNNKNGIFEKDCSNRVDAKISKMIDAETIGMGKKDKAPLKTAYIVNAVKTILTYDDKYGHSGEGLDENIFLLGTPAGVVDLKTGILRKGTEQDLITKTTLTAPIAETPSDYWAACPMYLQFLYESAQGDEDYIKYLIDVCGYCLSGSTRAQVFFFLFGSGGTGKSLFVSILYRILNDYSVTMDPEILLETRNEPKPDSIADLEGARLCYAEEVSGKRWRERRVKSLTGGDMQRSRALYTKSHPFPMQGKIVITSNAAPQLAGESGDAFRRRLRVLPFTHKPDVPDENLLDKIIEHEAPVILRMWINAAAGVLKNGLRTPRIVEEASAAVFEEADVMAQWLADCTIARPDVRVSKAEAYDSWKEYCDENRVPAGTKVAFSRKLASAPYNVDTVRSHGTDYFIGIALTTQS